MKIYRHRDRDNLVNMTPLIDVVFILLIFFMLAGVIKRPDVLPVEPARSEADEAGDEEDIVILISEDGSLAFNGEPVLRDADLIRIMSVWLFTRPDAAIQLKADGNADATRVIQVMELLREAGARQLVLLTVGEETLE